MIFNKGIRLAAEDPTYYEARAQGYHLIGDEANAMKDLNKAVDLDPDWAIPHLRRAEINISYQRYEKALEDLDIANSINSSVLEISFPPWSSPSKSTSIFRSH